MEILKSSDINVDEILNKRKQKEDDVSQIVKTIIEDVKNNGDDAMRSYAMKFDNAKIDVLKVSEEEINAAMQNVDDNFWQILEKAAKNIEDFHKCQVRQGFIKTDKPGVIAGQKITPLATVGLYVPGGTAAYPSTVLMSAIPAKIAGVRNIIMCTPPCSNGNIKPEILAAAKIAGINDIYKAGGAQAVAAMAYGTQTIPKTDKIVGPGNIFVATAKKLVYGEVDIDMIAGPSDVLIVADETAKPEFIAADMLAQAEHDKLAAAVLLSTSLDIAEKVAEELKIQLEKLPRKEIAASSIENYGQIIICESLNKAMLIANMLAPEHLEICTKSPFELLPLVNNAGSIFLGNNTPEALGDYFAGPNHTLPTNGTARFYSPLSVDDYVKKSSYLYYSEEALKKEAKYVVDFANAEGLQAHGKSIEIRL